MALSAKPLLTRNGIVKNNTRCGANKQ